MNYIYLSTYGYVGIYIYYMYTHINYTHTYIYTHIYIYIYIFYIFIHTVFGRFPVQVGTQCICLTLRFRPEVWVPVSPSNTPSNACFLRPSWCSFCFEFSVLRSKNVPRCTPGRVFVCAQKQEHVSFFALKNAAFATRLSLFVPKSVVSVSDDRLLT